MFLINSIISPIYELLVGEEKRQSPEEDALPHLHIKGPGEAIAFTSWREEGKCPGECQMLTPV